MTAKHFVKAAETITDPTLHLSHAKTIAVADRLAAWFAEENPRFDRARFMGYVETLDSLNRS